MRVCLEMRRVSSWATLPPWKELHLCLPPFLGRTIHRFRFVIARATQQSYIRYHLCLVIPLSASLVQGVVTGCAPGVWSWIFRIFRNPKTLCQVFLEALNNVLAHERFVLWTMLRALD